MEYREFKNIYRTNKLFMEEIKSKGLLSPGKSPTDPKDKKAILVFEQIHKRANEIYEKYLVDDSELQLNLPIKITEAVYHKLYDFHIFFEENFIKAERGNPVDLNALNIENVFDDVHKEAVDILFLNVYSSFANRLK